MVCLLPHLPSHAVSDANGVKALPASHNSHDATDTQRTTESEGRNQTSLGSGDLTLKSLIEPTVGIFSGSEREDSVRVVVQRWLNEEEEEEIERGKLLGFQQIEFSQASRCSMMIERREEDLKKTR